MSPPPGPQKIPRPPTSRPGSPPYWEEAGWKVPDTVSAADIAQAITRAGLDTIPITHQEAWLGTELTPRQRFAAERALRAWRGTSAVLVPVYDGVDGEARFILTRRSQALRSHTGEVAFPGGRVDEGELPAAAALREANEEIGLDPSSVSLIGHLDALPTVASASWIIPFVGLLDGRPEIRANPDEVERVFDVSVSELIADGVYREEIWEFPGFGEGPVTFFEVEGDTIWGATARMLRNLLEVVLAPSDGFQGG